MNTKIGLALLVIITLTISGCKKESFRDLDTYADWMTQLVRDYGDDVTLKNISMPAAHDAGNYVSTTCTVGGNDCNTKTQGQDMSAMLATGVRRFDIRPVLMDNGYFTQHTTDCGGLGCQGDQLDNMLQMTRDFLETHSELVVFTFGHWCDTNYDDTDLTNLVNTIMGDYLHKRASSNFINQAIGDILDIKGAKGKLVILYEGAPSGMEAEGIFPYSFLPTEGSYSNTTDFDFMQSDQKEKFNNYNSTDNAVFEISWTMTLNTTQSIECFVNPDGNSIESFANGANAQLGNSMQSWMDEGTVSKGKIPHVINIDFADNFVTDACLVMSLMNLE